ncbi:tetratricopeptide repeat protein [Lyngbya confervoides]|uniref:Tetratricopeptide repeat protein n=1 Tax=Lyngbya confervoides BDU141951 TaxID=1574623 RepID=A0ABD4T8N4_9CYAN|nr:tetratricopeptide repeat protein [Lyngbya confervoides]MCM1985011.1 tetratricopeptide repeat protein [Lyngbya confervoides BDU141951]
MALSDSPPMGSIADISARLLLWAQHAEAGMARVEFSSEFSRQQVIACLKTELDHQQIPFAELQLPTYREPMEIVDYILAELDQRSSGVVSIHGFSTAFRIGVPLQDAMLALNFNRERFAERPLRQIWWMTPVFYDAAQFAMPDLMSWFNPRLRLTEAIATEPSVLEMTGETGNIEDARQRAEFLLQRFEQGLTAGAAHEELLKFNLLPALEALAAVNAQKDLHDITSRFEGFLSRIQASDSPELAHSLDRLGRLYQTQGRYAAAEPLLKKALSLRCHRWGQDHLEVAASLNNLALLYQSQGRNSNTEQLYTRALEITEMQLGKSHPNVATCLQNLALLYQSQGRYSEAEALYSRSLKILEKTLGSSHPDVAVFLINFAGLCSQQGRYDEAESLYRQSLSILEQQLGQNHPTVATCLNNLAILCDRKGYHSEAESLYLRSIEIRENALGANHPLVGSSLNSLAELYRRQRKYCQSEPIYLRSLEILEHQLGTDHPIVAKVLNNLAELHQAQERDREAEPLYLRSLEILEKTLGKHHPDVATNLNNLAGLYCKQKQYDKAELLYLRSLSILRQQLGKDHPQTRACEQNFMTFLKKVIDAGQASILSDNPLTQNLLKQILATRSQTLPQVGLWLM